MKRRLCGIGFVLCAFLATTRSANAQQLIVPGGELDGYLRFLELAGQAPHTPLAFRSASAFDHLGTWPHGEHLWGRVAPADDSTPRLTLLKPDLHLTYNTANPSGINDGALWAGRGLSGAVTGGVRFAVSHLTITVAPTLWFAQNQDFDISPDNSQGFNTLNYPFDHNKIDWPQRFGLNAVTALDPGQSEVRFDAGVFTAGIGTENMWWGPSFLNPILMSSTAAGFPHLDLGVRPTNIGIGRLEARLVYGRLAESAYFDTVSRNDVRFLAGLTFGYEPSFLPGLVVGATRVFYKHWQDTVRTTDLFAPFNSVFKLSFGSLTDPTTNDDRDQIGSLFAQWTLPESGAEMHLEWARNDYNLNLRDFLLEPDHARGYTIGFSKRLPAATGKWRMRGEFTQLGRDATSAVRATPTYYEHGIVREGYTQLGQLIGAGVGPGGESEYLGIDHFGTSGRTGWFVQRVVHDADAYYEDFAATERRNGHDIEVRAGVSAYRWYGDLAAGGALTLSRELNRYFIVDNDVTNLNLEFWLHWR